MVSARSFTCYVVNRVEADSKPPDFVGVIAFDTPPCHLNSVPVIISERRIVVGVESRTFAKTKEVVQKKIAYDLRFIYLTVFRLLSLIPL